MNAVYMLGANICSLIIRERPPSVLERLQAAVEGQSRVVISVITYYEMLLGTIGRKSSPRLAALVESFVARLNAVLPWERGAAEEAVASQVASENTARSPSEGHI
jgi:tRNA(fMet)-specific endonuclease VapC